MKRLVFATIASLFISFSFSQVRLIEEAEMLMEAREYKGALSIWQELAAQKNPEPWKYQLGLCYFFLKDYNQATSYLQPLSGWKDLPAEWNLYLGRSLHFLGKPDEALPYLEAYKAAFPEDKMADIYVRSADFSRTAATQNPDFSAAQSNIAVNGLILGAAWFQNGIAFSNPTPFYDEKNKISFQQYQLKWTEKTAEGFDTPKDFANDIHTKYFLGAPSFTGDYARMYFSMNDAEARYATHKNFEKAGVSSEGINTLNIYFADKNSTGWSAPAMVSFNSREYSTTHPSVSKDGKKMVFAANKPGGKGGYDLYSSELKNGEWTNPLALPTQVNTVGDELYPFIWNDTLLFFASTGRVGYGGADLYKSVFRNGTWQEAENMGPAFNSYADDFGLFWTDARHGYFASNRSTPPGVDEFWEFEKIIHFKSGGGFVMDELTLKGLGGTTIDVYEGDSLIATLTTDALGNFDFSRFDPDKIYTLVAHKDGYKDSRITINPAKDDLLALKFNMEPIVEKDVVFTFNDILFDYGKSDILPASAEILDRLADLLLKNPGARVELSAHTDSRGSDKTNQELSQQRANSSVAYLISKGVLAEQLVSKGYGESVLKNGCSNKVECTEEEHAVNRRVEIKVLDVKEK